MASQVALRGRGADGRGDAVGAVEDDRVGRDVVERIVVDGGRSLGS